MLVRLCYFAAEALCAALAFARYSAMPARCHGALRFAAARRCRYGAMPALPLRRCHERCRRWRALLADAFIISPLAAYYAC